MKIQLCFVAVILALVSVSAHPGIERPDDDAEVVVVPLEAGLHHSNPYDEDFGDLGEPVVDTGSFPGFFSFSPFYNYNNPFAGFFSGLEANLARMRQEIQQILTRLPTEDTIISDLDKKGNTTSTVKIIDGHKVIVNETTFNAENDGGVIRIRVVEVKPDDDDDESSEQDIKDRFAGDDEEKVGEDAAKESEEKNEDKKSEAEDMSSATTEDVENDIGNEIDSQETKGKLFSLSKPSHNNKLTEGFSDESSDELVDDNFESNGWKVDNTEKWAEERPSDNFDADYRPETWESVESIPEFDDILDLSNDVDTFQPIDLSNDIRINQMMADSGAPINPDAEIIQFVPSSRYSYPRFESIRNSRVQRSMPIK